MCIYIALTIPDIKTKSFTPRAMEQKVSVMSSLIPNEKQRTIMIIECRSKFKSSTMKHVKELPDYFLLQSHFSKEDLW